MITLNSWVVESKISSVNYARLTDRNYQRIKLSRGKVLLRTLANIFRYHNPDSQQSVARVHKLFHILWCTSLSAQFTLYLLVTVKFGECYAYWVGNDCVAFLTDRIDRFHFIFQLRLNNTSILLNIMTSLHLFVCWLLTFLRHDHTSHVQNETQTSRYMY